MSNSNYSKRIYMLLGVFIFIFVGLWWRLKVLTIDESAKLSVWADSQYTDTIDTSDINYMLFDKNGKQLLEYNNKYFAVIDTTAFTKNDLNTKSDDLFALMYILRNYNAEYDLSKIGFDNTTKKIKYEVDESTYNKLKGVSGVKGFYIYTYSGVDRSEAWKLENLITSPRITRNNNFKDEQSLEMQIYNKTKNNQFPQMKFNKDIDGNVSSGQFLYPDSSVNVRLTLDKNLQDNIKKLLNNEKYKKHNQIGVILMESSTGKLLTMTQKDDSLPNVNIGAATENGFVPGSIFKVIVEEAGFETKKLSLSEKFSCSQDVYKIDKDKDHGILNSEDALRLSCNNIFAQIGDKVGVNNFIKVAKSQGLFSRVLNMDKTVEVTGDYVLPQNKGEGAGQLAIGQSMRITPLQAINIANTVVNNGIYVKPHIVEAYVDDNNKEIEVLKSEYSPSISKITANLLKNQMIKVVKQGTGVSANIDNIEIGGKTGTSTRLDGTNVSSDGWFVGFFKADNKYYSMVVFVKDIDVENDQAATTAVPIFKEVVQLAYNYLRK